MTTNLELNAKFWEILEKDLGVWSPLPVLYVPHWCQEGKTRNPWSNRKPKRNPAKLRHFDYVIRGYSRNLVCFSRSIWRLPEMSLAGWKKWSEVENLFWGYSEMTNQLNPARGDPEHGKGVLHLSMWVFTNLTTLYGNPEIYTCITSWRRTCLRVNIGDMFKNRTFWKFLCIIGRHMFLCIIQWMLLEKCGFSGDLVRLPGAL